MKYVILMFCTVGLCLVLLNEESEAAPSDNLYSCYDHGEFYASVRGSSTPCPPRTPVKEQEHALKDHEAGDPDCIVKRPEL